MRPSPPDFVIIGAMKCATSTLHDQLAVQSGIAMSSPKEPCFFSDDEVYARGLEWYESCFADAGPDDLRGESSTHYSKLPTLPHAVDRLAAHRPDARIIYVVRNPIDRLVSHFMHGWSEGWYGDSIEAAIASDSTLVDYGRYAMQLRPWLERFGAERVLLVAYDGIRSSPQRELDRIGEFLEQRNPLRWDHDLGARNVSTERVRSGRIRRWFVDPAWAAALRRALVPRSIRSRVRTSMQMRERPTLGVEARIRLGTLFDADLGELGRWLGREIRCETFADSTTASALEWLPETRRAFPVRCQESLT